MDIRQKSMIIGGVAGASIGVLAGYLFTRGLEYPSKKGRSQALSLRSVPPGNIVKLFIAVMGVLRGIAELGEQVEV